MTMDKYFSLNRTLLLMVGLWPYKRSKCARLQYICIFSVFTSGIVFQLTSFVTSKCTVDVIIKVLSTTVGLIIIAIKYISYLVNIGPVKYLIEYLQYVHNNLKDHNEIIIIEKYGSKARRFTTALTMLLASHALVHMILQLLPELCYIILSINGSRQRRLSIMTEYFIDQEKYFYVLLWHGYIFYYLGLFILLATATSLNAYLTYACGMFKIASYRIDNAMKIYISQNILQKENLLYKGVVCAIDIQRKAIMYSEYLISTFEVTFMFLIALGVLTLSLNIFRVFQIMSSGYNVEEFSMPYLSSITCLLYMFLSNLIGQNVTDHYNHVFDTTYKVHWYLAPLHIQKLILFLMQRGNKSFGLNVGGLFVASLECFATLANTSISYFIVMYSMR